MAQKQRQAYDVRALYGNGLTWVVRHHSLLGALWYLWRALRGRIYLAPGWPAEVLRYELVRVPEPYISGWDPLRQSIHLRPEEERRARVLARLEEAGDRAEADAHIQDYVLDGSPFVPPEVPDNPAQGRIC